MKKFLSLVMALVMTMSLVTISAGAKDFTDGDKITYDTAVDVMSAVKVVDGYTDGSFNPSATLTRGAAAKIICNLILGPTTASALVADAAPYKDVPANSTFAGYIAYCAKEGIISGYTDGTFKPGNTLTGYAFMKMLLGALGYDKVTEGYEGANWSINVAKRALNVGLDDGLTADFNGVKPVTREEACLFAFNALQATMVEYKNNSTIVVGDVTISTNAQASDVKNDDTSYKGAADGKMQFCEKYFPKLKAQNDVDAFGNYITNWKIGTTKVATSTDVPQLTYTTSVKYKDIYADLDLDGNHSFYYFVDGVGQGNITVSKAATTSLGSTGNGVLTSVYHDVDDAEYYNISVVNTYVAKVTSISKNSDGDRQISVLTEDSSAITATLKTTEWDVDDMVLVTIDRVNNVVKSIAAAEKLSGKLTKVSGKEYTIDGTVYKKSAKADMNTVATGKTVDFILDSYGYVIWADNKDSAVDLSELAIHLARTNDFEGTRSRLLFLDGTKKTVTTDADYSAYYNNRIVKFKLDGSDYELTDVTNSYYSGVGTYSFTNGTTSIPSTDIKVDGSTVFAYVDVNDNYKLTSYTGYKAAPTIASANVNGVAAYTKTNATAAAVVVIYVAGIENISSSSNKLLFLATAHDADVIEEEDVSDYYTMNAIDKGAITTVNVISSKWADVNEYYTSYAVTGTEEEVVAVYKTATYNKDGQIKTLTRAEENVDYYRVYSTAAMKNDVLTLGGTGYAVADDVAVYTMTNGEFAVSSVGAIAKDTSTSNTDTTASYDPYVEVVFTKNSDGEVDFIILVVKD